MWGRLPGATAPRRAARRLLVLRLALATLALAGAGCVRRSLFVRSDPDRARVFLDGAYVGETPRKVPFTFYGTRELVVRAPGRTPARLLVELDPPWWQLVPLDFLAEVLYPGTIEDERDIFIGLARAPRADLGHIATEAEAARVAAGGGAEGEE